VEFTNQRCNCRTQVRDFTSKIVALEKSLADRTNEVKLMQGELKMVKEFRKKRSQMQAELDGIREGLFETNRDHKHALQRMEQKFFDEKLRLEQEAGQKLSELAERAHNEAIVKLDDTTRNVYKENVRLTEALRCHIKESEIVQKRFNALKLEADDLRDERELNIATMRHNVIDNKKKKIEVRALREKNTELELAISNMINDFDSARTQVEENTKLQLANSNGEIQNLEKLLSMKSREANRVKLVARNIIEQRSDLEVFFHEALRQIREEISSSRAQYIAAAKDAYNQRMIDAHTGAANFPKVRTFGKANESSTNSIFADLQGAADTSKLVGKVDIRDLTWEQKEKVLRLLFARMNRVRTAKVATPQVLPKAPKLGPNSEEIAKEIFKPIDGDDDAYGVSTTFLTQQPVSTNLNPILPPIESKT